jgi:hypothetical protein
MQIFTEEGFEMYQKSEITRVVLNGSQCVCCKTYGGPIPKDPIVLAE